MTELSESEYWHMLAIDCILRANLLREFAREQGRHPRARKVNLIGARTRLRWAREYFEAASAARKADNEARH